VRPGEKGKDALGVVKSDASRMLFGRRSHTRPNGGSRSGRIERCFQVGSIIGDEQEITVRGLPAVASNTVPSNLVKASVSAILRRIMGNWAECRMAFWGPPVLLKPAFTFQNWR